LHNPPPPGNGAPAPSPDLIAARAALAQLADVARAAPRVWAWRPAGDGVLRASGRPPHDGRAVDTAAAVIGLLQHTHPEACTPAVQATLRRAARHDGSLATAVLLRTLQQLPSPH
jgi:hypothetical protein